MSTESKPVSKVKGRPIGYSPVKTEAKPSLEITEDGNFLVIKIPKKLASKLLLKDLF